MKLLPVAWKFVTANRTIGFTDDAALAARFEANGVVGLALYQQEPLAAAVYLLTAKLGDEITQSKEKTPRVAELMALIEALKRELG